MLLCWSSLDGEENVGDQEFFDDQQDQQEFANCWGPNTGVSQEVEPTIIDC